MPEDQTDQKQRLEIDWLKTAAGALAAVSSAVVLSTVGVAGTLIGAAVGSVIFTLSSSLYSAGLDRSRRRVARAQALAAQKLGVAQAEVRRAARRRASETAVEGHLDHADEQLVEAKVELDTLAQEQDSPTWRERFAALPWKRIAPAALGIFLVAVVAITAFELVAGRPVSSFTGGTSKHSGTSFTDLGGGGAGKGGRDGPTPTQAPASQQPGGNRTSTQVPTFQTTPTQAPTQEASPTAPEQTPAPSTSPTPTPTAGTTTPAPTPTASSPTAGAS